MKVTATVYRQTFLTVVLPLALFFIVLAVGVARAGGPKGWTSRYRERAENPDTGQMLRRGLVLLLALILVGVLLQGLSR